MTDYPWYDEVPPDTPVTQGDIIERCPVVVFAEMPKLTDLEQGHDFDGLMSVLQAAAGVEEARVIVLTQACDIQHGKVRNATLCPVYPLEEFREEIVPAMNDKAWDKHVKHVRDGQVWNLALLEGRKVEAGLSFHRQVVDFHEVFTLPLDFLGVVARIATANRARLLPPYREHLSQAFARYYMRVGLPEDIDLNVAQPTSQSAAAAPLTPPPTPAA